MAAGATFFVLVPGMGDDIQPTKAGIMLVLFAIGPRDITNVPVDLSR